ncbi:MAG: YihY/virulence factor BrkB family protein [Chloroflexi bacterium]|nr:MAG: hypothetical protein CUN54_01525 [Phototrophicales bacterium]RMF79211.1 MAG: YihY/virulence factor BrkB family protein [Chloroflexota bacterium]
MPQFIIHLWEYVSQQVLKLKPSTLTFLGYIWLAITNFNKYGVRQAASLAYYAIFSLFPLSLILAIVVSNLVGPAVAQEQIAEALLIFLPEQTVQLLQDNVASALNQSSSFGLIAVVSLLWSGLGLFSNITASLDSIFDAPSGRNIWKKRLTAFLMTAMLILVITLSFVASGVLVLISSVISSVWITVGTLFLPLGLDMVILALLFRFVPGRYVTWDAVWPAAILGAVGWEAAKIGFRWYLTNLNDFQFVYGGIATVIVLLFWAYLIASIFLFSAELCARLNEWFNSNHEMEDYEQFLMQYLPSQLPPDIRFD